MVLESRASANAPLWLREGLVVYLENPALVKPAAGNLSTLDSRLRAAKTEAEMRAAYRDSASAVAELVAREGLPAVLAWMKNGLPSGR